MRYVERSVLCRRLTMTGASTSSISIICASMSACRGYGQRDPLNEYKSEAFALFEGLLSKLRSDVVRQLMHLQITVEQPPPTVERALHHERPPH